MPDGLRPAKYDLHLHTCWSYDATARVETYFRRARDLGVRCIAVTEHHVLDSLQGLFEVAQAYPDVRAVPGAELTVTASIGAVDLLCYGFSAETPRELKEVLDTYHAWQRSAGEAESAGLQALGYDYADEDRLDLLRSYRPAEAIALQGPTHVKNAARKEYFLRRGFIAREEEYEALMARARGKVAFPPYPKVEDVVPAVKGAGALVAIAHPRVYFDGYDVSRMDALREELQLDGIECAHRSVPPEYRQRYRDYCLKHGLFSAGGSDCHADAEAETQFARHAGADEWLGEFLGRLDSR